MSNSHKTTVLVATFNGVKWADEQFDTILNQENVELRVLVSDDLSTDGTYKFLQDLSEVDHRVKVLPVKKTGSAAQNFLYLIRSIPVDDFCQYVALCDQDDLWDSNKLQFAINCIEGNAVDAYSCNVIAFWPNGKQRVINKAQKQRDFDYMFESAGPGCTFVMTRTLVIGLRECLIEHEAQLTNIALHDWFIYAYARAKGYKWFIDSQAHMLYRQHGDNVVGANVGLFAKIDRWKKLREGWLFKQAIVIARIVEYDQLWPISRLKRFNYIDKCILGLNAAKFRRRFRDQLAFAIALFFAKKP